ncbi:MAG: hypothetical protein AB7G37_13445, partial [Solirubrobacteraceae bacterium]
AKIGLRCGLLDALDNPGLNLCLGGALGGVNSLVGDATDTLQLGALGDALGGILGIDRTVNLAAFSIAPDRARAAFERIARSGGIYTGDPDPNDPDSETDGPVPGGGATTTASCLAGTSIDPTDKFVYIKQVGNGDEYCLLPPNINPRVLVVESGRVRVTGAFTGVLYAVNRQEIAGATTPAQVAAARATAPLRETVRIEYPGKVTGAVWTDGAGGQVGLYPPGTAPTSDALVNFGDGGICALPVLGPVLDLVGGVLGGVLDLVGGVLELVVGVQTEVRTVGGETTSCGLLKRVLGNLTTSQLVSLFGTGASNVSVPISEQRTRTCKTWLVVCLTWNNWTAWGPRDSRSVNVRSLLENLAVPNVLNQLIGTLSGVLLDWTAVDRDIDAIRLAGVPMAAGAATVPGTYRNVPPSAALVDAGT